MMYQDWGKVDKRKVELGFVPIPMEKKLGLAYWTLLGVFVLFILSGMAWVYYPGAGEKIFETNKTVLPPIATLVLAYFITRENA